jgi:hypothetical protein
LVIMAKHLPKSGLNDAAQAASEATAGMGSSFFRGARHLTCP